MFLMFTNVEMFIIILLTHATVDKKKTFLKPMIHVHVLSCVHKCKNVHNLNNYYCRPVQTSI